MLPWVIAGKDYLKLTKQALNHRCKQAQDGGARQLAAQGARILHIACPV